MKTWHLIRSGDKPEVPAIVARSRSFGISVANAGGAAIIVTRDEDQVSSYVTAPDSGAGEKVALNLAASVGAKAEPIQDEADLSAPVIGVLLARPTTSVSREPQAGLDPTEVAVTISRVMTAGQWVAMSLRGPSRREKNAVRTWYQRRQAPANHHVNESEALVFTLLAGGDCHTDVASLLTEVAAALPGFDIETKAITRPGLRPAAGLGLGGVAALLGVQYVTDDLTLAAAIAAVPVALSASMVSGLTPTPAGRVVRSASRGKLRAPRRRPFFRFSVSKARKNVDEDTLRGLDRSWPLASTSFYVGPSVVVGLATPRTEGMATTVRMREPAPALTMRIGPMVGTAGRREAPVYLSAQDLSAGVGIIGIPDAGKSVLLRIIYGWSCLERKAASGMRGSVGANNTMVAFETKGEGAAKYAQWAEAMGDHVELVELADPDSMAIDMFAGPEVGTVRERAELFIDAMTVGFGVDAIQGHSTNVLRAVFSAGLMLTPEHTTAAGYPEYDNPVAVANAMLCNDGDEVGIALSTYLLTHLKNLDKTDPDREDWLDAARQMQLLYGKAVTPAQRRRDVAAPRSKVNQLASAKSWWSPTRRHISWEQVLTEHRNVVVNTGVTTGGDRASSKLIAPMSAMLSHTLKVATERKCNGWQSQGRAVSIYADELSMLAEHSEEVIEWWRNQGRSYGVRLCLATQHPTQLSPKLRDTFLSFGTFFWFAQNSQNMQEIAAADLGSDGTSWSSAEVASLKMHHAVMRATVGKTREPAVPVKVAWFEDDLAVFPGAQGYDVTIAPSITTHDDPWQTQAQASDAESDSDVFGWADEIDIEPADVPEEQVEGVTIVGPPPSFGSRRSAGTTGGPEIGGGLGW